MNKQEKLRALIKHYVREALDEIRHEEAIKEARRNKNSALDRLYEEEIGSRRTSAPTRLSEGSRRAPARKAARSLVRDRQAPQRASQRGPEAGRQRQNLTPSKKAGLAVFKGTMYEGLFDPDMPDVILDESDPNLTLGFDGNALGAQPSDDIFEKLTESLGKSPSRINESVPSRNTVVEDEGDEEYEEEENDEQYLAEGDDGEDDEGEYEGDDEEDYEDEDEDGEEYDEEEEG
jgi:hypothetical protein